jgi:HEAT repeat protein
MPRVDPRAEVDDAMTTSNPPAPDARVGRIDALLQHALVGGLAGEEATSELIAIASTELPAMLERFPGPLTIDRHRTRGELPVASACGPLLEVFVRLRRTALAHMTVRSASHDIEQRFWATHTLGELSFPEAATAVLSRLFDTDSSVRRIARRSARALCAQGGIGASLLQTLQDIAHSADETSQRRLLAVEALGEVRSPQAVPILVGLLALPHDAMVDAARAALGVVTRQDLGRKPEMWEAWWRANKPRHRIEWLIDALTHEASSLRRAAGEELEQLTKESFGYFDDLPTRELERAQQRYRAWWDADGRYRFH